MIGIYKITNLINGNSYIGQSIDIHKRWKREKEESKNVNSHSYEYPLMRSFRKYGFDNFSFEVIEECKIEELNEKELYWIEFYDTFFHGYNQTLGGDSTSRQPKENVIGVMNDLKNTDMSHKDIANKWDMSQEMVQGINTGRYWRHNTDYPLQKRKEAKIYYCKKCGKQITRGSSLCADCYRKSIPSPCSNKPDKDTLFSELLENEGNFTELARKYGVKDNSIRKWCVKYGIPSHSSDYYKKEIKIKQRPFKICVVQLDKNTEEELNTFDSISDAARHIGLNAHNGHHISDVCKGKRKTAYGYKWKFI